MVANTRTGLLGWKASRHLVNSPSISEGVTWTFEFGCWLLTFSEKSIKGSQVVSHFLFLWCALFFRGQHVLDLRELAGALIHSDRLSLVADNASGRAKGLEISLCQNGRPAARAAGKTPGLRWEWQCRTSGLMDWRLCWTSAALCHFSGLTRTLWHRGAEMWMWVSQGREDVGSPLP